MSKIVALDIDGVLFVYGKYAFSPAACKNLQSLLDQEPDLKIVISSSWRHLGLDQCKNALKMNGVDSTRVIDKTGDEDGERGVQIQAWVDRNPEVTSFVVIDDESDFSNMKDRLVQTNGYVGLTKADVDKCLDILKKPV
jgi:hypothetical protein